MGGRSGRLVFLIALSIGALMVGVELMVTAVALPRIVADLADWTQLRRASWVVNGYLVAYIAMMPLAGRAADRFGLPRLFAVALVVFAAGSAAAGAAQDLDQLIAARVIQGLGAGAIVPLATAGASHLYEGAARARALGIVGALTFLGMALGPFAGAAVLENLEFGPALASAGVTGPVETLATPSWRWIFYLGVPFSLLALAYTWAASTAWNVPRLRISLDLPGALLFTLALASALVALTWLGTGEDSVSLVLGGVAVAATLLTAIRLRMAREPFLEPRYLRDRTFASAVLLSLLTGYALATAIVGGAVFVDRVRYAGPDEQRFVLGALAGAMAVGALVSGFALRWLGVVTLSLVGVAMGIAGLAIVARADATTDAATIAGGLALFGLGFGVTVTPRSTAAVEALGRAAFGLASAGVTVARMMGMAVGLAVLTAFGSNRIDELSAVLTDAAQRDRVLMERAPELVGRPLEDGLVIEVLERWAADQAAAILAGLFAVSMIVMAAAILPALLMHRRRTAADRALGTGAEEDEHAAAPAF